ncbi:hypothetical protein S245_071062, partial [Arachis hypogaea]
QFAQRSRVCKLQYIAELERNVQGLQAEGSEVSAKLEFLNQENLILSMENKSLKQRKKKMASRLGSDDDADNNKGSMCTLEQKLNQLMDEEAARLKNMYREKTEDIEGGTHKPKFQTDLTLPIYLKFSDVTYKVVMKGMTTSEENDILKRYNWLCESRGSFGIDGTLRKWKNITAESFWRKNNSSP